MYGFKEAKELFGNSQSSLNNVAKQWAETQGRREYFNNAERAMAKMQGLDVNAAAVIPRDVYQEFDAVTKEIMRSDEGDVLLNDLLPLARSVDIGKIEYKYRQASDSGNAKTTLSGQSVLTLDKTQYKYDSALVPVHQDAFGREWRELAGQRSEGFDGLIDDQRNSVKAVRRQMVNYIVSGDAGVVFNGASWGGLKSDSRVVSSSLAVDLTSGAVTAENVRNEFKKQRDALRITNNAMGQVTFYVSREIMSNLERYYSGNDAGFGTMLEAVKALNAVADVKETSVLSGNEILAMVLDSSIIRPVVGMAVSTVPVNRMNPFDAHNFITWGAMGIQVMNDYDGRSGVLYATTA